MVKASRLLWFTARNNTRHWVDYDSAVPTDWHSSANRIAHIARHIRGVRSFKLVAELYTELDDPTRDCKKDCKKNCKKNVLENMTLCVTVRDKHLHVNLRCTTTSEWARAQVNNAVDTVLRLLDAPWDSNDPSSGHLTLTEVAVVTPLAYISDATATLVSRNPGAITSLVACSSDIERAIHESPLLLPEGLTSLERVKISELDTACLAGVSRPLRHLEVRDEWRVPIDRVPRLPIACIDCHTVLKGKRFMQPDATYRLRCIESVWPAFQPSRMGWRARLLDVESEVFQCTLHCDAIVIRKKKCYLLPTLTGAPGLLVARVVEDDPVLSPPKPIIEALRTAYPQAMAFQVEYASGLVVAAFADDRMPARLAPLVHLVVALGIASGDDGAKVKAEVRLLVQLFAASGARCIHQGYCMALKHLVWLHAGHVISTVSPRAMEQVE